MHALRQGIARVASGAGQKTLGGKHWMFETDERTALIDMCESCRLEVLSGDGADPFAIAQRPRVRTTDDYLEADRKGRRSRISQRGVRSAALGAQGAGPLRDSSTASASIRPSLSSALISLERGMHSSTLAEFRAGSCDELGRALTLSLFRSACSRRTSPDGEQHGERQRDQTHPGRIGNCLRRSGHGVISLLPGLLEGKIGEQILRLQPNQAVGRGGEAEIGVLAAHRGNKCVLIEEFEAKKGCHPRQPLLLDGDALVESVEDLGRLGVEADMPVQRSRQSTAWPARAPEHGKSDESSAR